MTSVTGSLRRQVAALPFRRTPRGAPEVLLLTSRKALRFILPKGWPSKKLADFELAALKAYEEAGVVGKAWRTPVGDYLHWQRPRDKMACVMVNVYAFEVRKQLSRWPQMNARQSNWFSLNDAAGVAYAPGLAELLKNFDVGSVGSGEKELRQ
jgi:hypothetical protein